MKNFFNHFFISFFIISIFQRSLFAFGYIYPIEALRNDPAHIFLMQKTDADQILLWRWNANTKEAALELNSFFAPMLVRMLPKGDGFSFVQDGLPRIKLFSRRSPRTIELSESFSSIDSIEWIDEKTFYFCAMRDQKDSFHGIYESDISGQIRCLIADEKDNFFSPFKVDDNLFFIHQEGGSQNQYTIRVIGYSGANAKLDLQNSNVVANVESQAAGFLSMSTKKSGFFVTHAMHFELSNEIISCGCCFVSQNESGQWHYEKIFDFHIPIFMLMQAKGQTFNQLISPFIPRFVGNNSICCIDHNKSSSSIILFDMKTKKLTKIGITRSLDNFFIGPLYVGNRVFVGSILQEKMGQDTKSKICRIKENNDGVTEINLASFSLQ